MRQLSLFAGAFILSFQALAIREHLLDFPDKNFDTLYLPSYFEKTDQLHEKDSRLGPISEGVPRDDVRRAREYILNSHDLSSVLDATASRQQKESFKREVEMRRQRMKKILDDLYEQEEAKAAKKILNTENANLEANRDPEAESLRRRNENDRSATIALTQLVADYMEYNQKKRVSFKSNCLQELNIPGAEDSSKQVDINYMVFDFDRYPRLAELKYYGASANKGPVLLLPGRAEPSYKWVEYAHELNRRGYGPIMSIDHRGQGLSSRVPWVVKVDRHSRQEFVPTHFANDHINVHKVGHVDLFRCYIDDVHTFMTTLAQPILDAWHEKYPKSNNSKNFKVEDIIVMGHSTGGAIAQGYLMRSKMDQGHGVASAAVTPKEVFLISPMFGLDIWNAARGLLGKWLPSGEQKQDRKKREKLSWSKAWSAVKSFTRSIKDLAECKATDLCLGVASDTGIRASLVHDPLNITTHSAARYLQYRVMINLWPEAKIAGLSANWLREANLFFNLLHNDPHEYKETKLRIYLGGDAGLLEGERVVDNSKVVKYCNEMMKDQDFKECSVIPLGNLPKWGLQGARHALHTEDDWYREQMLRDIDVRIGGPFLLHDMIVRCEEAHKMDWHQNETYKFDLTEVRSKKEHQKLLADACVPQHCRNPAPANATAAQKLRIDQENSACLVRFYQNQSEAWLRHGIPQMFLQQLK